MRACFSPIRAHAFCAVTLAVFTGVARAPACAQQPAPTAPASAPPRTVPPDAQAKLDKFQSDLKTAEANGDAKAQADALLGIGSVDSSVSELSQALEAFKQALAKAAEADDTARKIKALDGIATAYNDQGHGDQAQPWFQQELDLATASSNMVGQARALKGLARVDYMKGAFSAALDLYTKALDAAGKTANPTLTAAILSETGLVYSGLGQPLKAIEVHKQALEADRQAGDRRSEAQTLNNLGIAYSGVGNLQQGLDAFIQAQQVFHQLGDRSDEARTLNNQGLNYNWLGDSKKALAAYEEALRLRIEIGDRRGQGITLGNMGLAYYDIGEIQKALDYYNQALVIRRELGAVNDQALTLINVGNAYSSLGQYQKALDTFSETLALFRKTGNRDGEAIVLEDIGAANDDMGNPKDAIDPLQQSLAIARDVGDRDTEAQTLNDLGMAWSELGDAGKAIDAYNQALPILRDVGDRANEATALDDIGDAWLLLNQPLKAADALNQALPIAVAINNPLLQAGIFHNMLRLARDQQPALAVFYGKQAVNLVQQVRGNVKDLDKEMQKSFLEAKSNYYHDLADLLIAQGRLPEAQQVLDLFKQQEYQDYVRGDAPNALGALTLTPAEQQAAADYSRTTGQIIALGEQWSDLKKIAARTPEQDQQFQQISDQLDAASKGLNDFYARLYSLFGGSSAANKQVADVKGDVSALKQTIAKMPHTVALYTLVGSERVSIIVITGSTAVAREFSIPEKDLNQKVAAFQQALRNPHSDARPLAEDLYKILIAPVKTDLDQAQAKTLVWSLDGVLRYVPIAALFDGRHYLVENYATVNITPVSIPHLNEKPDFSDVSAAAMGISRKYEENLPALPAVAGELDEIVKDAQAGNAAGVLPGTILLNGAFTEKAMENLLDAPHNVVHIASHFVFRPGDDSQSYLLLAGKDADTAGYHLTVAGFRDNQRLSLDSTDLLTLSACETGMSSSAANGREVDGLATTAQLKGAKAVLSSLWEVNDASTGELMADFYKRWAAGEGKFAKVEALREAQLDLLRGNLKLLPASDNRGFSAAAGDDPSPPAAGYAHPYFWAPFVLMGNWR